MIKGKVSEQADQVVQNESDQSRAKPDSRRQYGDGADPVAGARLEIHAGNRFVTAIRHRQSFPGNGTAPVAPASVSSGGAVHLRALALFDRLLPAVARALRDTAAL